jgi:vacuolar protein sorting-associated protein 13A/C
MDMVRGETIIQDVKGLSVEIRRSLRDLMHQLPVVEAAIKVAHFLIFMQNSSVVGKITICFLIWVLVQYSFFIWLSQVDVLKAALSNREYEVISECASSNFAEAPHVIPALDGPLDGTSTSESHISASSISSESNQDLSQDTETWIANKFSVSINLVELSLHSGSTRDSPLASVQVLLLKEYALEPH